VDLVCADWVVGLIEASGDLEVKHTIGYIWCGRVGRRKLKESRESSGEIVRRVINRYEEF
jgi:hypothetical protein